MRTQTRSSTARERSSLRVLLLGLAIGAAGLADPAAADEPPTQEPDVAAEAEKSVADQEPGAASDEASEATAWSREGAWLGVGGAYAAEHFDRKGSYDDSGVLSFRAGYRGLPNVAIELLGEVLPEFQEDGAPEGDVDGFLVTANGKLFLPLGRAEPWVMAGVGLLDIDAKRRSREDDFAFRFAAGLDAYLTPRWAIYLEAAYVLPTGDVEDYAYSTYGAGILFRF